jgi:glycosyltransferase involved in cell wall biosynthesis
MRIALVHDWLNHKRGGAEAVLLELARLYPEADIYSLIYQADLFPELTGRKVVTSSLQQYPKQLRNNPKYLLPAIRRAVEKWQFGNYDLVISSSNAWVKNITIPKGTKHICYCHSPARMLWDQWPSYLNKQFPPKRRIQPARLALLKLCSSLRVWDYYGSRGVSEFVANSDYIASRIKKFYGRSSTVIYPPVLVSSIVSPNKPNKDDFYLVVSTLAAYKQINLAVEAFKKSGRRLIIAGDGADRKRLEDLAAGQTNIQFKGFVDMATKFKLMQQAKGFVFCSIEDFGIAPVEAMAAGTAVIALRGGGLNETIIEGKTGVFFDEPSADSLNHAISKFEKLSFSKATLVDQAKQFSDKNFDSKFKQFVKDHAQ